MSTDASRPATGIGGAPLDAEDPRADLRWGTVPALVADMATRLKDQEALIDGATRLTYGQLAERAAVFSRALMADGLSPETGWLSGRRTAPSGLLGP